MQVLSKLPVMTDPNLLVGLETGDDAAVYKLSEDIGLVFTVDFFPPVVDDPFSFGQIAASNALSDVYAMGARPLFALNIVGFPAELPKDILGEILKGGYSKAQEAKCLIAGGHTIDDKEPKYGMAVLGIVKPGEEVTKSGSKPGDKLILTKPLGTGIITTAAKQGQCSPELISSTIELMATLNSNASKCMVEIGVNAATDVTGFGLIGHLSSMMKESGTSATIQLSSVPAIEGVWKHISDGMIPGGSRRNAESSYQRVDWTSINLEQQLFLCDAQTSGGLLISVDKEKSHTLINDLHNNGCEHSVIIGEVKNHTDHLVKVVP